MLPWIWTEGSEGDWTRRPVEGDAPLPLVTGGAALVPLAGARPRWALLAAPDGATRVNARPVLGVRLLADRDEIVLADATRLFFSTETPATVEPYAGPADAVCPRCRTPMIPGRPAVTCPNCGCAHHQDPDGPRSLPCYRHADACAVCGHPTHLGGEPRWSPEEI